MSAKSIFYVVLSGLITASAVAGWCSSCDETAQVQPQEAQSEGVKENVEQVHDLVDVSSVHEMFETAIRKDADFESALKAVSSDSRISEKLKPVSYERIKLVSPDRAPWLDSEVVELKADMGSVMALLQENETLKSASTVAFVDVANGKVLAATDVENASRLLAVIANNPNAAKDVLLHAESGKLMRLGVQCLDEQREKCIIADKKVGVHVDQKCKAVESEYITCDGQHIDISALVDADGCGTASLVVLEAARRKDARTDIVKVDDDEYKFEKSTIQNCEIVTVAKLGQDDQPGIVPAAAPVKTDVVQNKKNCRMTPMAIGMGAGAGLLMILLGFACVRRKEEDKPEVVEEPKKIEDSEGMKKLQDECRKANQERDDAIREKGELSKTITRLENEKGEAESRNKQLNEQLEHAKQAFKQEQLQRMSLAEDNRKLEDAIAASNQEHTNVGNPVMFARAASKPDINTADQSTTRQTKDLKNADPNRVTAPVEDSKIQQITAESSSHSLIDLMPDEGWDEIEDSFDAIFSSNKLDKELCAINLLDNSSPSNDDLAGVSSFIKEVRESDVRMGVSDSSSSPKHIITETNLKPIDTVPKPVQQIPSLLPKVNENAKGFPKFAPKNDATGLKSSTLNGVKKNSSTLEKKLTDSASEMATRRTGEDSGSFKPSPSWSGKSVVPEKGIDENSLIDALKRRAKDVSEIDNPSGETSKKSGAFDYNKGISKSGVFSVTGSRVDIDPLSDTEYFKSLFEKYIETQRSCGEATDKFTMEQFVSRLAREKAELIRKYKCSNVKFAVTVKDGRASLKATPQK